MSDEHSEATQFGFSRGPTEPSEYSSPEAKARFAVAKYYGMGSDGKWSVEEIADALGVSARQVYTYLNESAVGRETREIQATTEAEWRLETALALRGEIDRLESIERELLDRTTIVPTEFEEKTVKGTPNRDGQIVLAESGEHSLTVPIPSEYEELTDYGRDLERIQVEKRRYLGQIITLLGLDDYERPLQHPLKGSAEEPVVEFRERSRNDEDG